MASLRAIIEGGCIRKAPRSSRRSKIQLAGVEALGRVELPTNGLGNRCSIHLSYRADTETLRLNGASGAAQVHFNNGLFSPLKTPGNTTAAGDSYRNHEPPAAAIMRTPHTPTQTPTPRSPLFERE